jgi:hypothetical protein
LFSGPFRMALFPKLSNARRLRLGNPSWKYAHEFAAMGSPEFDCRRFGPAFAEAASRRQVQSSLREPSLRAWFCFCRYLNLSIGSDSRVVKWLATRSVWSSEKPCGGTFPWLAPVIEPHSYRSCSFEGPATIPTRDLPCRALQGFGEDHADSVASYH